MTWAFGKRSEEALVGVQPPLVAVARRALQLSAVDFGVHDGLRTEAEQRALVASGASRSLDSHHLTGHALDLVPYVGGKLKWLLPLCIQVARAVHAASLELNTPIVWGAIWDRELGSLAPDYLDEHVSEYIERFERRNRGRKAFVDAAHYQMRRA